jgi:uncharacterized membrane protein
MLVLQLVFRWFHILGAILLVGGAFYHRFAFQSGLAKLPETQREEVAQAVRSRWAILVMISSGILLVSGMVNFSLIVGWYDFPKDEFPSSIYHPLFGLKFLAALAVFYVSSRLAGGSSSAAKFRQRENLWSTVNLVLAILIICCAGLMKMADRSEKGSQSSRSIQSRRASSPSAFQELPSRNAPFAGSQSQLS